MPAPPNDTTNVIIVRHAPGAPEHDWGYTSRGNAKLENTPDGDDAHHGRSGPFPIRQRSCDALTPSLQAFVDAVDGIRQSKRVYGG